MVITKNIMIYNLKIKIFGNLKECPWGGGNQFLKALEKNFKELNVHEENIDKANCILFCSYQNLEEIVKLKIKYPDKIFVHRLGTILHFHRGRHWKKIDHLTFKVSNKLADKSVFISEWLCQEAQKLGFKNKKNCITVNAVDGNIEYCPDKPVQI